MRDESRPDSTPILFQSPSRASSKKLGAPPLGILTLYEDNRLTFERGGRLELDANLSELENIQSPWWVLGSAVHFTYQGKRWYCNFNRVVGAIVMAPGRAEMAAGSTALGAAAGLAGAAVTIADSRRARKLAQAWKAILDERKQLSGAPVVRSA